MSNLTVVGCGALNWDCLFHTDQIVVDGECIVKETVEGAGGSAANTIYTLAYWGIPTGFIGIVGDDEKGRKILSDFKKVGVDTKRIRIMQRQNTGQVIGIVDSKGNRSLYVQPSANLQLRVTDEDLAYIASSKWLHLSSLVGDEAFESQRKFVLALPEHVSISFAPGALYIRLGLKRLEDILRRTTVLFTTSDELLELMGEDRIDTFTERLDTFTDRLDTFAERLWSLGVKIVVITMGEKGSWVKIEGKSLFASSVQSQVVDSTGAGDAFAAGFLFGFLQGQPLENCQRLGTVAASFCVSALGARTKIPTMEELLKDT